MAHQHNDQSYQEYKQSQVYNRAATTTPDKSIDYDGNRIDGHEQITAFLRFGDPLQCIVVFDKEKKDRTFHKATLASNESIRLATEGDTDFQAYKAAANAAAKAGSAAATGLQLKQLGLRDPVLARLKAIEKQAAFTKSVVYALHAQNGSKYTPTKDVVDILDSLITEALTPVAPKGDPFAIDKALLLEAAIRTVANKLSQAGGDIAEEETYGRILFTRVRADLQHVHQICSFGFIRRDKKIMSENSRVLARGDHATVLRSFQLVRDRMCGNDIRFTDPADMLRHIARILGMSRNSLEFWRPEFPEIMTQDPLHIAYFNKYQKSLREIRDAIDVAKDAKDAAETKRLETHLAKTIKLIAENGSDETSRAHGFVLAPHAETYDTESSRKRQFDYDSQRILSLILNQKKPMLKGETLHEIPVEDYMRFGPVQTFKQIQDAMEAQSSSKLVTEMFHQTAPDLQDATEWQSNLSPSQLSELNLTSRSSAAAFLTAFDSVRTKRRNDLEKKIKILLNKEVSDVDDAWVDDVLRQAAANTTTDLCLVWMNKDTFHAAIDCANLTILRQPAAVRLGVQSKKSDAHTFAIAHELLVDFFVGWSPLSREPLTAKDGPFIRTGGGPAYKSLERYIKDDFKGAVLLRDHFVQLEKDIRHSTSTMPMKLSPLIAGIQGWCRGARESDIVGMLLKQAMEHRCVTVPTGNPHVYRIYWSSRVNDKRCVVRDVLTLTQDKEDRSWSYVIKGNRQDRKVLLLDTADNAHMKLSQRMALHGLDVPAEDLGLPENGEVESHINLRELSRFVMSDTFTYRVRAWKDADELEIQSTDARVSDPDNAAKITATQFLALLANEELNGKQRMLQPMHGEYLRQCWEKFQQAQKVDFQNMIETLPL